MGTDTPTRVFPVPWVTEAGVTAFFAIAGVLLLTRPDYDPLRRYISEYAVGPGGWAMRTGFALLGLASLNLVPGFVGRGAPLRDPDPAEGAGSKARRAGLALGVWGVAVLVAAAFPVDLQGAPVTGTGGVHLAAAGVGFLALIIGMAQAVGVFRGRAGWADLARPTRWAAILTPTAFVLEATVFSTVGWVGVGQWLLFGLAGGWVLLVGRRFRRLARGASAREA